MFGGLWTTRHRRRCFTWRSCLVDGPPVRGMGDGNGALRGTVLAIQESWLVYPSQLIWCDGETAAGGYC